MLKISSEFVVAGMIMAAFLLKAGGHRYDQWVQRRKTHAIKSDEMNRRRKEKAARSRRKREAARRAAAKTRLHLSRVVALLLGNRF